MEDRLKPRSLTICVCNTLQVVDRTSSHLTEVTNEWKNRGLGNGDGLGHCEGIVSGGGYFGRLGVEQSMLANWQPEDNELLKIAGLQ